MQKAMTETERLRAEILKGGIIQEVEHDETATPENYQEELPIKPQSIKRKAKVVLRRCFSESNLHDILDHDLEPNTNYFCITGGNIDAISYMKVMIRKQRIKYAIVASWCFAMDDVLQFKEWIESGQILWCDFYMDEIFRNTYGAQYEELKRVISITKGRICTTRNHAKIMGGYGFKFPFLITGSANLNTNNKIESQVITTDKEVVDFYKDFYDNLTNLSMDFMEWQKWRA